MLIKQIRYYVAVAEEGHFGRAAQRLRIAQPALSRQIKLLEESIGVELFHRLPRGVRLSPAGKTFLDHCSRMLIDFDRAVSDTQAVHRGNLGSLHLGFIEVAAWQGVMPQTVLEYRRRFPDVDLMLSALPSLVQIERILDGSIDGGFLYNPPQDPASLASTRVARHRIMLAVPADSPSAGGGPIPMPALAAMPLILFQRRQSPLYYDQLTGAFLARNIPLRIGHLADDEAGMLAMVTAGSGVALVNECQRWRPPHGVVFLDVEGLDVHLDLAFVHNAERVTPALANFLSTLAEGQAAGTSSSAGAAAVA